MENVSIRKVFADAVRSGDSYRWRAQVSECAIQLADRGFAVKLCEMRPQVSSPAHHTDYLAELVCSNSFKSTRPDSAAGLLKAELERMGSVLLDCAHRAAVPAGGALAVDRVKFSEFVEAEVAARPNIEVVHGEVTQIPEGHVVIAAGPLCSPALSEEVMKLVGGDALAFFDAAAPIVDASTLDMDVLFSQSRCAQGRRRLSQRSAQQGGVRGLYRGAYDGRPRGTQRL